MNTNKQVGTWRGRAHWFGELMGRVVLSSRPLQEGAALPTMPAQEEDDEDDQEDPELAAKMRSELAEAFAAVPGGEEANARIEAVARLNGLGSE